MITLEDFPDERISDYLRSLCGSDAPWWKTYGFMDEIDDATWFEFELDSKTQDKPKQPGEKPTEKTLPVLQAVKDYAHEKILIVGSPGAGKSTLLARLLWQAAQKAQQNAKAPVPVLVELKLYGEAGIWELIQTALENCDLYLEIPDIKKLVEHRRLLLLADGFNELPSDRAKAEFKKFCARKIPLIVTSRDGTADLELERKLQIQPLTNAKVKVFLQSRFPGAVQARIKELGDRVKDFGQTPLMVWMLFSIFRQNGDIPTTRGEAYRTFTTLYAEKAKEGIDLDESRDLLSKLAFELMHAEKPTDFRLDISEFDAQNLLGSKKSLDHLVRNHLLQAKGKLGNRRISFCHQSLQEYYAAEAFLVMLRDKHSDVMDDQRLQYFYLNYLKWTETIAIVLSLMEDDAISVEVVRSALKVDWLLGARLAGEVRSDIQKQTVELVNKLANEKQLPEWLKVRLWGETCSEAAVPGLLEALESEDCNVIQNAASALAKHNCIKAIPVLLNAINHPALDFYASFRVATLTGKLSSGNGIPVLLKALKELDRPARLSAVSSLGENRSDLVVELLPVFLKLLQDGNIDIRRIAANALKDATEMRHDIRLIAIVPELLKAVNDPDLDVCLAIIEALGNLGSTDAILDLLQAMKDSDTLVRDCVVNALDDINRRVVANSCVQTTPTQELIWEIANPFSVNGKFIDILERNTFSEAIPHLLKALENPDKYLRCGAAEVLGRMVATKVIPDSFKLVEGVLLKLVTDPCSSVRESIAKALGEIRSTEAIPSLLKLLEDSYSSVRSSGAIALGKIGSVEGILGLFKLIEDLECYEDEDECFHVRSSAAEALGKFQDDHAAHILPNLLELIPTHSGEEALRAITAIQANCQFYNYTIAQWKLTPHMTQRSTLSPDANVNTYIVEKLTLMSEQPPIFHQHNPTIGVNYAAGGSNPKVIQNVQNTQQSSLEAALNAIVQIIRALEQKYTFVQDEQQALQIIDAEFKDIQAKQLPQWQDLMNVKRLWNGGKKAAVKVGEHYAQENPWGKGLVAFLEGVSEDVK